MAVVVDKPFTPVVLLADALEDEVAALADFVLVTGALMILAALGVGEVVHRQDPLASAQA